MIKINPAYIVSVEIFEEVKICENYEAALDKFYVMSFSKEKGEFRRYIDEDNSHYRFGGHLWQKPFVFIKTVKDNRQLLFDSAEEALVYIAKKFPDFIHVD